MTPENKVRFQIKVLIWIIYKKVSFNVKFYDFAFRYLSILKADGKSVISASLMKRGVRFIPDIFAF